VAARRVDGSRRLVFTPRMVTSGKRRLTKVSASTLPDEYEDDAINKRQQTTFF